MTESAFAFGGPKVVPDEGKASILDRLKARTVETVAAEVVTFPIGQREGFAVAFSKYLPENEWTLLATAHQNDKTRFAKAVLVQQCRHITVDGEVWNGSDDAPVTFKSSDVWAAVGATDAFSAISALYLIDPDVLRTADAVLRACGWDLTQPVDPTQP